MNYLPEQWSAFVPGPVEQVHVAWGEDRVSMLRLDKIHSWASGNKYYKLKYTLDEAYQRGIHTVVSKGGMFSNHLHALSEACSIPGFKCVCIIRSYGNDPANPTLQYLRDKNCELIFLDPAAYDAFDEADAENISPGSFFIPEGGESQSAIRGASEILNTIDQNDYNHIIISGGTMTTAAGILQSASENILVSIVPAWKGCTAEFINALLEKYQIIPRCNWTIWPDFHFGGFAKSNQMLVDFMQTFTSATHIPLDPVYSGKMMFGIRQRMVERNLKDGHILAIHTGGLQGIDGATYRNPKLWSEYRELCRSIGRKQE